MGAQTSSKVSYFNTLIFTIVSGIVSLMLLMLLFFDLGKKYIYLIITIEVGIFMVIGMCLYMIIKNELELAKGKDKSNVKFSFTECPDYFVKTEDKSRVICKNNYTMIDPSGIKYTMRIYPADKTKYPLPLSLPATNPNDKNEQFDLYHIEQTPEFKDARDQCAFVGAEPKLNSSTSAAQKEFMKKYEGYSALPWTHAQSRCAPFVDV